MLDSAQGNTASMWHTDESFLPHPPMGTLTHAKVLPDVGGDTLFCSTTAAYEALSPNMKRYLEGLTAVHDLASIALLRNRFGAPWGQLRRGRRRGALDPPPGGAHPPRDRRAGPVREPDLHPVHRGPARPTRATRVLAFLYRHQVKEAFTYRHRWADGDLLIWDNRVDHAHGAQRLRGPPPDVPGLGRRHPRALTRSPLEPHPPPLPRWLRSFRFPKRSEPPSGGRGRRPRAGRPPSG